MTRRALSRGRIIDAAIRIADDDGFAAVALRRIAADLGVHVTSLYNHVPNFEAVIEGMLESLLLEAKLPTNPTTWQRWVEEFMGAIDTIARTHPGAFGAFEHRPAQGPAAARTFEVGLEAFGDAGLDTADAYCAVKTVVLTSIGIGIEQAGLARIGPLTTDVASLPAQEFRRLRSLPEVAYDANVVTFAVETTVAGLGARLGGGPGLPSVAVTSPPPAPAGRDGRGGRRRR